MKKRKQIIEIFFRTTGPIATKVGTKHPCVQRFQVCSNKGSHLFARGDNNEDTLNRYMKMFFFRITGTISTKLGKKHSLVKLNQVCSNDGPSPFF